MSEIQRYIVDAFSKHDWSLEQDNFGGDLVKYDDHAAIVAQLEERNSGLEAARLAYASEFPLNSKGEPDVGSIHQNIRKLKSYYAQLETDLASAKTAMQEISKLHDHEMSGNEIRMNAYDMACLARKFLSDAAIEDQGK